MQKCKMGTERLFLRSPNINVCFRIIIDRIFERQEISAAVDTVCTRHPLLACALEIDNAYDAWFVPAAAPIVIEFYTPEEMPDWKVWHTKADNTPFDFVLGPLAKMCVVMGNGCTEIIVVVHHIAGDGIGCLNLAKDLLLALDNKLDPTPQMPPANNAFLKGTTIGFLPRLYVKKLNREWRKSCVRFSEEEYQQYFYTYRNKYIPNMYMDSINEADLQKLIEVCTVQKITVNELLTSAFATALSSGGELRVGVAASTRSELKTKPHFCMGNYVTGIAAAIHCTGEHDFMANVKNISAVIRKKLSNAQTRHAIVNFLSLLDNDLIEAVMFACYGTYQLPIPKKIGAIISEGADGKGLGISNLGRHNLTNYDRFRLLDLQFIGPVFPANKLSVSIITVNNKLNITLRYNEAEIETAAVTAVYQKAIRLLSLSPNEGPCH